MTTLGHCIAATGRVAEALPPAEEAAEIYRRLARTDAAPALYRECLILALTELAKRLRQLGRLEEADAQTAEAAEVRNAPPEPAAPAPATPQLPMGSGHGASTP